VEKVLHDVGIAEKAYCNPLQLSEGEQQRVGIARALINNPTLILADEPTGNLDPVTSAEIMQLLVDINRNTGTTMFISTHDFMMIDKFPARVVVCENGTVVDTESEK
jgi:cell division transport system ATP-binding protein